MGYTVIAPVGDNLKALFIGMKEFPTKEVILITPTERCKDANKLVKKLDSFTIPSKIIEIKGNLMQDMFRIFGEICANINNDDLIVNVATGDRMSTCASLSAAYANGLKAFGVAGNQPMLMPIMKLSYYTELSDNKMTILGAIGEEYITLKDLADSVGMSLSLISYHINGNYKYKGLKEYRLVLIKEGSKHVKVKLSDMGKLLLGGYIKRG